jgi:hypothetical protein
MEETKTQSCSASKEKEKVDDDDDDDDDTERNSDGVSFGKHVRYLTSQESVLLYD